MEKRLEILKPLVKLKDPNDFFVVRILQRGKDVPGLERSAKQLKVYSFYNWDEFNKQKHRIIEICELNKARAYLRLNTQNAYDISLKMQKEIVDNLLNNCAWKNEGVWNSVSGKGGSKDWWVIDLDKEHLSEIYTEGLSAYTTSKSILKDRIIIDLISEYQTRKNPIGKVAIAHMMGQVPEIVHFDVKEYIIENKTKTGIHLIVKPFDARILEKYNKHLSDKGLPVIQIQKDANTVLYIGNGDRS